MDTYQKLKKCIENKIQVTLIYGKYKREVCPHAIGLKKGKAHVLVYQFAGQSSKGLSQGGEWRCMDIAKIVIIEERNGQWFTSGSHKSPQTCVDSVDIQVKC